MDILKKSLAPVTDEAWEEINSQAKKVFQNLLTARKFVDIDGPKGITFGAVSLGRLKIIEPKDKNGVNYGIHKVLPLIEVRKPFHLDIWELDNATRGAEALNLEEMESAAGEMAKFEEEAIYHGFTEASIKGLRDSSAYKKVKFPDSGKEFLNLLGQLINQFHVHAVGGPYSLIVSPDKWSFIFSQVEGFPLIRQIEKILGGSVMENPNITDSYLVSARGGDFRLILGQDMSIGFDSADTEKVKLYFTESFTFRVLEPNAVVILA